MPIAVPAELAPLLEAADRSVGAIDEFSLPGRLAAAIAPERELTSEERKGAFAEIAAWRFQRSRSDGRRTWSIYWSELASWSTTDGRQVYSPDIADVDGDVIGHWIKRSEEASHPTIRARLADLAWEIGLHNKVGVRITQEIARRAIDEYLQATTRGLFSDEMDAWLWLDRASELAQTIKDETRILAARLAAFSLLRTLSTAAAGKPISLWRFDDIMWSYRLRPLEPSERAEVIDALERELKLRSDISNQATFDPHVAMDISDRLQRWRKQTGETEDAKRALLTAGQADPFDWRNAMADTEAVKQVKQFYEDIPMQKVVSGNGHLTTWINDANSDLADCKEESRNGRLTKWFLLWWMPMRRWVSSRSSMQPTDLDDVAQEVFLRLMRYSDDAVVENPQSYLFRIASNVVNEWRERARNNLPHDDTWLEDLQMVPDDEPESSAERTFLNEQVRTAVGRLPPRQRDVLLLHVNEGLTCKQIADRLDLTLRIVRRDIARAYVLLRAELHAVDLDGFSDSHDKNPR